MDSPVKLSTKFGSALLIASLLAACGGASTPSVPAVVTPSPVAGVTPSPESSPTLSPIEVAAAHIEKSVGVLINTSDLQEIATWMMLEAEWLKSQPDLPVLATYRMTVESELFAAKVRASELSLTAAAKAIIAAARDVPGVDLP